jgi:hypothetical protein
MGGQSGQYLLPNTTIFFMVIPPLFVVDIELKSMIIEQVGAVKPDLKSFGDRSFARIPISGYN